MSPHRRYQTSSLNFGISPQVPITPAEHAVIPCLTLRKIPSQPGPSSSESHFAPPPTTAPPPPTSAPLPLSQWGRHPTTAPSTSSPGPAHTSSKKGDKTYRVCHHHQNHYEPPVPVTTTQHSSLSQGIFGLPILNEYLKSVRAASPPPSAHYGVKSTEDKGWEYEELGDTKLLDSPSSPTDPHHYTYQQQKEMQQPPPPKPRMKTTLPSMRPETPPYLLGGVDEMDGIIQVRPATASRSRPEQHSSSHVQPLPSPGAAPKKGPRRRVKSHNSALNQSGQVTHPHPPPQQQHHQNHPPQQQQHHQYGAPPRVSTANSQEQPKQEKEKEKEIKEKEPAPNLIDELIHDCLIKLKSPDWEEVCKAFREIQGATLESHSKVEPHLKRIIWAGLPHFTSARTKISRTACQCFKVLYQTQKRAMEGEGDKVFQKLMDLSGVPTSKFIQDEAKSALLVAVQHIEPNKCIHLFEQNGVKHRNANVREFTALLLGKLMDRLQAHKIMNTKEYASRIVPMIVGFLREGQLNTRLNAKECLGKIIDHPQFNFAVRSYCSVENVRHVKEILAKVKQQQQQQQQQGNSRRSTLS